MVILKKSIDRIVEECGGRNVMLLSAVDRAFRRVMDSI